MSLIVFASKPNRFIKCPTSELPQYPTQTIEMNEVLKTYFLNYDQILANPDIRLNNEYVYYENFARLFHFINEFDSKITKEKATAMIASMESTGLSGEIKVKYKAFIDSLKYAYTNGFITWFKCCTEKVGGSPMNFVTIDTKFMPNDVAPIPLDENMFKKHHLDLTMDLFKLCVLIGYKLGIAVTSMWLAHIISVCNVININNVVAPSELAYSEIQSILKHAILSCDPEFRTLDEEPDQDQLNLIPDIPLPYDFDLVVELERLKIQAAQPVD